MVWLQNRFDLPKGPPKYNSALSGKMSEAEFARLVIMFMEFVAAQQRVHKELYGGRSVLAGIASFGLSYKLHSEPPAERHEQQCVLPAKQRLQQFIEQLKLECPLVRVELKEKTNYSRVHAQQVFRSWEAELTFLVSPAQQH